MDIKKLTEKDLEILVTEIDEALAPVAQKHGLKLSCCWDNLQRGGMSAALLLTAEVICPPECSKQARDFAFYLAATKMDAEYGLSWEDYGKQFTYSGLTFKVIGAYGCNGSDNSITVVCDGNLYKIPAKFVADCLHGKAKAGNIRELTRRMNSQRTLAPVPVAEANTYASSRKWDWAAKNLPQFAFDEMDYGAEITLYGKKYTIEGFVDFRPYTSVLLMDPNNRYYKAPAYKVSFALGRVAV